MPGPGRGVPGCGQLLRSERCRATAGARKGAAEEQARTARDHQQHGSERLEVHPQPGTRARRVVVAGPGGRIPLASASGVARECDHEREHAEHADRQQRRLDSLSGAPPRSVQRRAPAIGKHRERVVPAWPVTVCQCRSADRGVDRVEVCELRRDQQRGGPGNHMRARQKSHGRGGSCRRGGPAAGRKTARESAVSPAIFGLRLGWRALNCARSRARSIQSMETPNFIETCPEPTPAS